MSEKEKAREQLEDERKAKNLALDAAIEKFRDSGLVPGAFQNAVAAGFEAGVEFALSRVPSEQQEGRWTICRDCTEAWPTETLEDATHRGCDCPEDHRFAAVEVSAARPSVQQPSEPTDEEAAAVWELWECLHTVKAVLAPGASLDMAESVDAKWRDAALCAARKAGENE